jgi:DNA-binding MarR family transcriptional regulator
VSLTISAIHKATPRSSRRKKLADELLTELTSWTPRERMGAFRKWHHGALSLVHLNVLTVLEAEGPMSMGRVADALDVSVSSATGIVSRMMARGVVERRHDADDRRVVLVHLTPRGAVVFQNLEQQHRERLAKLLEQLTEEELSGFLLGLRSLHAAKLKLSNSGPEWSEEVRPTDAPGAYAVPKESVSRSPAPAAATTERAR